MSPDRIAHAASSFLLHVLDPALRSLLIGSIAALGLSVCRVKNPAIRLSVWTAVLYAALAMPLLELALPQVSIRMPAALAAWSSAAKEPSAAALPAALPAVITRNEMTETVSAAEFAELRVLRTHGRINLARDFRGAAAASILPLPTAPIRIPPQLSLLARRTPSRPFPWLLAVAALYLAGVLVFLARIAVGIFFSRRLSRSAQRVGDCDAIRLLIGRACAERLSTSPELAESDLVSVPVTMGIVRPVIVLPSYWREWDEAALAAVIAHEVSHIARRDALTQRLSLLYSALFWFSPLAWWMNRSLVNAAEEASDEAALLAGADRAFYAETLLEFFAALGNQPNRVYWQGVAMAAKGQAERRLDRILNWKGALSVRIQKSLAVVVALFAVPVVMLAAAARPAQDAPAPAPSSVMALQPAAPAPPLPRATAALAAPQEPVIAPEAQSAPNFPVAPVPVEPPADAGPNVYFFQPKASPIPAPVLEYRAQPFLYLDQYGNYAKLQAEIAAQQKSFDEAVRKQTANLAKGYAFESNPDFAQETSELEQLEARLQALRSMDTESHPDVLNVEKEIAELQSRIQAQVQQAMPAPVPVAPTEPIPSRAFRIENGGKVFTFGPSDRYVIVSGNSPMYMNGDSQDLEHATGLRGKINGDFIWFQRDEKSYIIRDQNLVNQAKAFFKPEQDLGEQQSALGKQQRDLGDQMRSLGDKMRDTKVNLPDMSAQMQKLMDQMKQLNASGGGTAEQLGDLQRQLGDLQRQIGRAEQNAVDPQRQTGDQMRELGGKMRDLGSQQRDLGSKQRDAAKQAREQMKQLLDDAVSKGTAQPE